MTPTTEKPEFLFVASREVREIPKGWQHPRDARGSTSRCSPRTSRSKKATTP